MGRSVPKHLVELPGSMHLGRGLWIFKCALKPDATTRAPAPATDEAQATKGGSPETNQDAGNTAHPATADSFSSAGARPSSLTESSPMSFSSEKPE